MGSPKKIIQSVVHQMTTRSGAAASADPVVDTNNCPDPAGPSETSIAATVDHDKYIKIVFCANLKNLVKTIQINFKKALP